MRYCVRWTETFHRRLIIVTDGPEEAKEKFWTLHHRGDLDVISGHPSDAGPQNVTVEEA